MDKVIVILENQIALISPKILWAAFLLIFVFALIFSLILNHHWRLYEATNPRMHRGRLLYFIILGFLLLSSLTSLIIFQNFN